MINPFFTAIIQNGNDYDNYYNGYTFQMKFGNESQIPNYEEAIKAYKMSKDYYQKILNKSQSNQYLRLLENAWNNEKIPPTYSRP